MLAQIADLKSLCPYVPKPLCPCSLMSWVVMSCVLMSCALSPAPYVRFRPSAVGTCTMTGCCYEWLGVVTFLFQVIHSSWNYGEVFPLQHALIYRKEYSAQTAIVYQNQPNRQRHSRPKLFQLIRSFGGH